MSELSFVTRLVDRLVVGLVNVQIHGPTHSRVQEVAAGVAAALGEYGLRVGTSSVALGTVGGQVVFEGRPVLGATLFAKRLLARIEERRSGGIEFKCSARAEDLCGLLAALARRGGIPADVSEANADLEARGVAGVRFLHGYAGESGAGPLVAGCGHVNTGPLVTLHQDTVDLLQGATVSVCQGKELDLGHVGGIVEGMISGLDQDAGFLHSIAHYPEYDIFTFGHSIRVALLALDVARHSAEDPALLRRIGMAALLHDVGKALVPWEVLHKPGRLTPEERREIERHPVLGAGVLLANRGSDPLAVAAAYGHHCTADGQGYPRAHAGFHQAGVTRLVKICDVYEALTGVRPYKPVMSSARAFRIMLGMTGHFDLELLGHFVRTVGIYPAGSRVRLDDGSIASVVHQTGDLDRPVVTIVESVGGPVEPGRVRPLDLTRDEPGGPTVVTEALPAEGPAEAAV